MSNEHKDVSIGTNNFRIRLYRSFKAQCDLLRLKRDLEPDDVIKADCEVEVLEYDKKGQVQGKQWVPVTDDFTEMLTSDDGLKLYNEVIEYRLKKKDGQLKSEPTVSNGLSKKSSSEKEESSQSV